MEDPGFIDLMSHVNRKIASNGLTKILKMKKAPREVINDKIKMLKRGALLVKLTTDI